MKLIKDQVLYIDNIKYVVVNMIEFEEDQWIWQEYEIIDEHRIHKWLTIEENEYNEIEYYLYTTYRTSCNGTEKEFSEADKTYRLYDQGIAKVRNYFGNADVDMLETCEYYDYMSITDRTIISIEKWIDEIEKTIGEKIGKHRIKVVEPEVKEITTEEINELRHQINGKQKAKKIANTIASIVLVFIILIGLTPMFQSFFQKKSMRKYIEKSNKYIYVTSITNNVNKEKAKVYKSLLPTVDSTVKDIIDGIPDAINKVTNSNSTSKSINSDVGIQTRDEFAYVYKENSEIFVQVSKKKYVNNSSSTYHSHHSRRYYSTYNSSVTDKSYMDYSSSARQKSVNSRTSMGGGTSSGK